MIRVTHFIQYFEKTSPDKTPLRQALYYYLKFFCSPLQALSSQTLRDFYLQMLSFPYWQCRVQTLSLSLQEEVRLFFNSSGFSGEGFCLPPSGQVVPIHRQEELQNLIKSFALAQKKGPGDQIKTLPLSPHHRVLLLILKENGCLEVLSYAPFALLEEGTLQPLTPLTHLYYTKALHLSTNRDQQVENPASGGLCRFRVEDPRRFKGSFHTPPLLKVEKVFHHKTPEAGFSLFTSLKFMESFFISSHTDPHYKNLIRELYGQYQKLLTVPPAHPPSVVRNHLKQARQALKEMYPSDRLLMLFIANMEHCMKAVPTAPAPQNRALKTGKADFTPAVPAAGLL